jgi:hypothetical protein
MNLRFGRSEDNKWEELERFASLSQRHSRTIAKTDGRRLHVGMELSTSKALGLSDSRSLIRFNSRGQYVRDTK